MEKGEIEVTTEEQFATFRQVITPTGQESVPEIFSTLLKVYRDGKITGPMVVNFNQGGVRNIVADQTCKVPSGSAADKALEEIFGT